MALKLVGSLVVIFSLFDQSDTSLSLESETPKASSCDTVKFVRNGHVIYKAKKGDNVYEVGARAILVCYPGHYPVGNTFSTCCMDGLWRPLLGFVPISFNHVNTSPYVATIFTWLNEMGTKSNCERVIPASNVTFCPPYSHGQLPRMRYDPVMKPVMVAPGGKVYLECPPGEVASGNIVSVCTSGIWYPNLGVCVKAKA